jgi:hypothetical protein
MDTPSMPGPGGSNSALTYEDANGNYNTVFLTSGYLYAEPKTCGAVVSGSGVTPSSSGPTITATFIPSGGLTLKDAAAVCGVQDFDWQQIATRVPKPSPFFANSDPSKPLVAPPDFFDPPLGGYTYAPGFDPFPFYYRAQNDYTGMYGVNNLINHEPTPTELDFQDQPQDSKLLPGKVLCYSTSLVGVLPSYTATAPLATFYWTSNYNGVSGVVTFQKCPAP